MNFLFVVVLVLIPQLILCYGFTCFDFGRKFVEHLFVLCKNKANQLQTNHKVGEKTDF